MVKNNKEKSKENTEYELIIIGSGPAGLSAGIYSARYKLKTLILSKNMGGAVGTAYRVCNYPSYTEIKGFELAKKFLEQVNNLGVPIVYDEVIKIERQNKDNNFKVYTKKQEYECKKIIFAAGTERNRLGVPGEGKFLGKGVSYCATCDASFFEEKIVAVIGGSDAAINSAVLLSEYASKVYIIYRGKEFYKLEPYLLELLKKEKNIESIFNEEIAEIIGSEKVEGIKLKSGKKIKIQGIFVEAGSIPGTKLIQDLGVNLNNGYITTDKNQKTNIKGFFAAGDVTNNPLKQIVTAAAEGAIAAYSVFNEIKKE